MSTTQEVIFRHPSKEDAQMTLEMMVARDISEYGEPDSSLDDLQDQWHDIDLNQDAWLAFSPEDRLVGYAAVFRHDDRFTFDTYTHPTLAPEGLTAQLLIQCEKRAIEQLDTVAGCHPGQRNDLFFTGQPGRQAGCRGAWLRASQVPFWHAHRPANEACSSRFSSRDNRS